MSDPPSTNAASNADDDPAFTDPDLGFRDSELFWYHHYDFFGKRGYILRDRYKPGVLSKWILDWRAGIPLRPPWDRIEAITTRTADPNQTNSGIDAVRIKDGTPVFIKCLTSARNAPAQEEVLINEFLSSGARKTDPRNACAPLLDTFAGNAGSHRHTFMVFPFLRNIRMSPFRLVVEVLTLAKQLLEAVVFLHEHNIAHRDIHIGNVVMDTTALWPRGVRPLRASTAQFDVAEERPEHDRIDVNVSYKIIDLGLATRFKDRHLVTFDAGVCVPPECFEGRNLSRQEIIDLMYFLQFEDHIPPGIPERTRPYDAFKADVFQLGMLLLKLFCDRAPVLRPLLDAMTDSDPEKRPTATECLETFTALTKNMSGLQLLWPASDISYEWEYSGLWGAYFKTKAFTRHWFTWSRLVVKALVYRQGMTI
ncbi:kinase-like protein [Exidia glandulosa HHB12029]|uniref:Kinase-like protein n=1 Tax=Exidia glandulosa HHB12029 TaxID=1314781 RepID=A0A165QQQ5_EXIGL|nr:kinase-like protein [Exidia glandulosa HHB12029]